jgi:hypothetical protein
MGSSGKRRTIGRFTHDEIDNTLSALNGNVYESTRTRLMILLRLDSILSDGSAKYDHKVITVEHVFPQNPESTSQWVAWIPDEEKRRSLVHRLGNLALLSRAKNSSARNYELEKKKNSYFRVKGVLPFVLTTQVLSRNEWTENVILERQSEYMEKLTQEWNLKKHNNAKRSFCKEGKKFFHTAGVTGSIIFFMLYTTLLGLH